jgi:hypothetical protein
LTTTNKEVLDIPGTLATHFAIMAMMGKRGLKIFQKVVDSNKETSFKFK